MDSRAPAADLRSISRACADAGARLVRCAIVTDPGFLRLRRALTTVAALGLAALVLTGFGHSVGHTMPAVLLGSYVCIQASVSVKDRTQRQRVVTTAFLIVPALAAVTLGTALLRFGRVAGVVFAAVLFVAVWVRRWGPRGLASGMVAYIGYFYALVLHTTVTELPLLYGGVCAGVAVTLLVRVLVFPERPLREIRSLIGALRVDSRAILQSPHLTREREPPSMKLAFDRLEDIVVMIEDWLDRNDAQTCLGVSNAELSRLVFEAQACIERAFGKPDTEESLPAGSPEIERACSMLNGALRPKLSRADAATLYRHASAAHPGVDTSIREAVTADSIYRAAAAHARLEELIRTPPDRRRRIREHPIAGDSRTNSAGAVSPSTRTALQVAAATAVATAAGELLSPSHWYWAAITAFLVYNGASTEGEVLVRAGERVTGTIGGVVAGMLIVAVVGHHPAIQIVLVLTSVFWAYYLQPINYALQTLFMTIMLAGLYTLLGEFSVGVLVVRIEETAIGAVLGIAAAYLIFATSSRQALTRAVDDYFEQLSTVVDECSSGVCGLDPADVVSTARLLDTKLTVVSSAAAPFVHSPMRRRSRTVVWLEQQLRDINRGAHALASASLDTTPRADSGMYAEPSAALVEVVERVRGHIARVRHRNARNRIDSPVRSPKDLPRTGDEPTGITSDQLPPILPPLLRIDATLSAMLR
ncbi:FUSC family protein [Rhodococcus phenolicus]|uniref:FUSC family protein n=1 Tax=Rhodococcus phenolicus TaxID=263849 RepID=UPI0009ED1B2F|nr:FUSC family protein [Rhodococcus phenolicus]